MAYEPKVRETFYDSRFGTNMKKMREQLGISQKKLAEKIDVTPQAVSKWENYDGYPSLEQLIKISRTFHVSIDALVTDTIDYDEYTNEDRINYKLKQVYYAYRRGESIGSKMNDIVASIISFDDKSEFYWMSAARMVIKGTFYAMLEDENVNEDNYTVQTLKDILQFSNFDSMDRREKVNEYFKDKSKKCRELLSVYLENARTTGSAIIAHATTYVNLLSY